MTAPHSAAWPRGTGDGAEAASSALKKITIFTQPLGRQGEKSHRAGNSPCFPALKMQGGLLQGSAGGAREPCGAGGAFPGWVPRGAAGDVPEGRSCSRLPASLWAAPRFRGCPAAPLPNHARGGRLHEEQKQAALLLLWEEGGNPQEQRRGETLHRSGAGLGQSPAKPRCCCENGAAGATGHRGGHQVQQHQPNPAAEHRGCSDEGLCRI